ncbi:MAG: BMP family ABC transporter substrate-binding protein, partial [Treponema sp.]|nr:BMP family ABC transporter substrate-binding protein [Treponema sp.]
GVDVIAQHQDTTAPQIAAQERGAAAVGYNVSTPNAAPSAYLTAPLFHWEVFYVDDVKHALAGDWQSRAYWEGFSNGHVTLDTLTGNNDPRTAPAIAQAEAKIKDGSFDPFTGPLADQSGAVKVPAGTRMTDDEIWNMGWFVKGVVGAIPQ